MTFEFSYCKSESEKRGRTLALVVVTWPNGVVQNFIVDKVVCSVPTESVVRETQPKFVMVGECKNVVVNSENEIYLTNE